MERNRIGFIGFGEVASVLSKTLCENGAEVQIYDILLEQEGGQAVLEARTKTKGLSIKPLRELIEGSDYILSTVTTQVAVPVARECSEHLKPGHIFVDLNSTAPSVKVEIDGIIRKSGADFVEGAILGAIGATGDRTKILTGGNEGYYIASVLTGLGLNVQFYSLKVGKASMFKMLRSIFSKGLEALLLEMMIAGRKAGIDKDLWEDVMDLMKQPFDKVAANWILTHSAAYERRYHEVLQVVETIRELGLEPIMARGTGDFFKRSVNLNIGEDFDTKPTSYEEVIQKLQNRLEQEAFIMDGGIKK